MTIDRPFSVRGKRVTVVGAARSGVAAAELLVRRGATVTLTDVRDRLDDEDRLRAAGVDLELGGHHASTFTGVDLIVTSPGVPYRQPFIEAARHTGIPVIGELELASRWLRGKVVAITGTKGKSTTTTLTGRMLEAGGHRVLVGGNIGHALSAQVDESTENTIHVIETSSFQLETADTFHPWIAVLLNFSPDHLDRHATVEEYSAAKTRIFAQQESEDWAVLNADDNATLAMAAGGRARQLLFSMRGELSEGIVVDGEAIVRRSAAGREPLVPLSAIRLLGPHLVADVLAASAVAWLVGVDAAAMMRSRASPMAITVARRSASGAARSAKSPPLKRPPRMTTRPSPKLSMARRAASMLVAFESFTNCTPAMSVTGSSACSSPVNPSTAAVIAAGCTPAMWATAEAAITSTSR